MSSIMRIGAYQRLLQPFLKHFQTAEPEAVKLTLDVMKARRENKWKWSADKETMLSYGMHRKMFFHPTMARLGLETMNEEEKKDFIAALKREAPKLST